MANAAYPYRVVLHDRITKARHIVYCRTHLGAWWVIGEYRTPDTHVMLEIFDASQQRYIFARSLHMTEYL